MMELLRPSIEEAQPIHSQELALDYIGKRSNQVCVCALMLHWVAYSACITCIHAQGWAAAAAANPLICQ